MNEVNIDMKSILLFYLFFLFTTSLYSQSDGQKVLEIEKLRFAAMVKKDTAFLNKILADSLLYIHSDGHVDSKKSLISAIAQKDLDYRQMELKEITIREYPRMVILSGNMDVTVYSKKQDKILDLRIRYLDVYHKIKNKWQLVAWQSSRLN